MRGAPRRAASCVSRQQARVGRRLGSARARRVACIFIDQTLGVWRRPFLPWLCHSPARPHSGRGPAAVIFGQRVTSTHFYSTVCFGAEGRELEQFGFGGRVAAQEDLGGHHIIIYLISLNVCGLSCISYDMEVHRTLLPLSCVCLSVCCCTDCLGGGWVKRWWWSWRWWRPESPLTRIARQEAFERQIWGLL